MRWNKRSKKMAKQKLGRHASTRRVNYARLATLSVSTGFAAALLVGLLKIVDSNHQEPSTVVLGYMAASFFWVSIVAGAVLWLRVHWRRRRSG